MPHILSALALWLMVSGFRPLQPVESVSGGSGSGTPGGSASQVQWNNGGSFAGITGATTNGTALSLTTPTITTKATLAGATETTSNPVLDVTQTWNNAGVTFTGLLANITNTASATQSKLFDLRVDNVSKFTVNKAGHVGLGALATDPGFERGTNTDIFLSAATFAGGADYSVSLTVGRGNSQGSMLRAGVGLELGSGASVAWGTAAPGSGQQTTDTFLRRGGAATLQLGLNAATAIPQTLKSHDGLGTDKAGADLILAGGYGTGTGIGGDVILRTAPASTTGSAPNTPVERMRVSTNGSATFAGQTLFTDGTTANPGIARSADVDDGIMLGEQIYVVRDGIQWVGISGSGSLGSIAIYTSPSLVTSVRLVGDASVNNVLQIGDDSATPAVVTLHGPDGVGTDIVGGDLRLGSGRCTGAGLAGACGKLILASTDIGVTGTTPRTLTDRLVVPQDGGLQFLTATKPTCNAAHRGTVFYVAGGAGVADTSEICRKDASDLYAWTTLF